MALPKALDSSALRTRCDPAGIGFETTADLAPPEARTDALATVGQERALAAIEFGAGMRGDGFNIFVMGPTGGGKEALARDVLGLRAAGRPCGSDWCYVHDFTRADKPRAIELPAGEAVRFRAGMQELVEELRGAIPAAFDSDDYRTRIQELEEEFKERQESAMNDIASKAGEQGLRMLQTQSGFVFAPVRDGEVLGPDEFMKLAEDEQQTYRQKISAMQDAVRERMLEILREGRKSRERVREVDAETTAWVVDHALEELRAAYGEHAAILSYLDDVREDVITSAADFRNDEETPKAPFFLPVKTGPDLDRYDVNVIVDRSDCEGAPVVYEEQPTHPSLVGRVEYRAQMGALSTDFSLIKAGALHRANGGYLLIDARRLLMAPFAWDSLKAALHSREIRIESVAERMAMLSTASLEPEPIPLDLKVVLFGDRQLYYLLYQADPEFAELFKVVADFEDRIVRDDAHVELIARRVAAIAAAEELAPFDRHAVAAIVEQASRSADDAERLSTHAGSLADLVREAAHWAAAEGAEQVGSGHVHRAIDEKRRRAGRIRDLVLEQIERGTVLIDTAGEAFGRINGLSVIAFGEVSFGQPSRITATTRLGQGSVIDIEREARLAGPSHTKGVMILTNYLAATFGGSRPLALTASLVFEQSYGHVDGDSASVAELVLLLAGLAGVPIRQNLAVTGSINQQGDVQAIGGVNEKIEGFFDVCRSRGFSGDQGVVIPAANTKNLMLRDDIVRAAEEDRFRVWAVTRIEEAAELLTGLPFGTADDAGTWSEGSLGARIDARLAELLRLRRNHGGEDASKNNAGGETRGVSEAKGEEDEPAGEEGDGRS